MKQSEKTKRTKEKIMAAAMEEFGTKSYDAASLNTMCIENQISKGLIYHNFKNKDQLYLQCVGQCYAQMTEYLQRTEDDFTDVQSELQEILHSRQVFFAENPYCCNIFLDSILQPPKHLQGDIRQLKKGYDMYLAKRYRNLLGRLELREGISEDFALEYFIMFQEMFNRYFREKSDKDNEIKSVIENHESKLEQMLNIMLYGIAKETGEVDTKC